MDNNEKILVHISNKEVDRDHFLRLTPNELAFLRWLDDNSYLDYCTYIDENVENPGIIEF